MPMFGKKKSEGHSWEYIKRRYPDVVEELKLLRDWDSVKASIVEAESSGKYSIVALHAIAALRRETQIDLELLSERVEEFRSKLENMRAENEKSFKHMQKELENLKQMLDELDRRTLFMTNLERIIPRINEIEERLDSYPLEIAEKMEKKYAKEIEGKMEALIQERLKGVEEELQRRTMGVSVNLQQL